MRTRSNRRAAVDDRPRADPPAPLPGPAAPGPLITTRALLIILVALVAAGICVLAPQAAIPIGVGVGVVTLLAQIVKD